MRFQYSSSFKNDFSSQLGHLQGGGWWDGGEGGKPPERTHVITFKVKLIGRDLSVHYLSKRSSFFTLLISCTSSLFL